MYIQDIKINAGTIWSILSTTGSKTVQEIEELTGYNEKFIFLAMGWLAKEEKIRFVEKNGLLYFESKQSNYSEMYY